VTVHFLCKFENRNRLFIYISVIFYFKRKISLSSGESVFSLLGHFFSEPYYTLAEHLNTVVFNQEFNIV